MNLLVDREFPKPDVVLLATEDTLGGMRTYLEREVGLREKDSNMKMRHRDANFQITSFFS